MTGPSAVSAHGKSRAWVRPLGLFGFVVGTGVVQPAVLVGLPLALLLLSGRSASSVAFPVLLVAALFVFTGSRDALWFAERAWAVLLAGSFAAATWLAPQWRLTARALVAVAASAGVSAVVLAFEVYGWAVVDWSIEGRLREALGAWAQAVEVLGRGDALSPAFTSAIYRTLELQARVFPAMVALESMAALGVAWWLYRRLTRNDHGALAPLAEFRFNDHLVWVLITGLALLVVQVGDGVARVGINLAVFMGALYGLRGLGVLLGVSGGLTLFGGAMLVIGILFAAPVVIGVAVLLGLADTWLDVRARVAGPAA